METTIRSTLTVGATALFAVFGAAQAADGNNGGFNPNTSSREIARDVAGQSLQTMLQTNMMILMSHQRSRRQLGAAYNGSKGDNEQAIVNYRKALEINPSN